MMPLYALLSRCKVVLLCSGQAPRRWEPEGSSDSIRNSTLLFPKDAKLEKAAMGFTFTEGPFVVAFPRAATLMRQCYRSGIPANTALF